MTGREGDPGGKKSPFIFVRSLKLFFSCSLNNESHILIMLGKNSESHRWLGLGAGRLLAGIALSPPKVCESERTGPLRQGPWRSQGKNLWLGGGGL